MNNAIERSPMSILGGCWIAHGCLCGWDARPFPYFPAWADGENYARGHWIRPSVGGVFGGGGG